ncbi:MAG: CXXX repeat peptide maturase [Caulobacteraceae bacterium]
MLLLSKNNLANLSQLITGMYPAVSRVNLIPEDIEKWDAEDIKLYESELDKLVQFISVIYDNSNALELNVFTDILNLDKMCNCDCGSSTYSLAPNGKIYLCPAFYFNSSDESIGDLDKGINIENAYLLDIENAPICSECDAYHCRRCKHMNKKITNEINTPTRIQCILSHIERTKSMKLQRELLNKKNIAFIGHIDEIDYIDPLDKLLLKSSPAKKSQAEK